MQIRKNRRHQVTSYQGLFFRRINGIDKSERLHEYATGYF